MRRAIVELSGLVQGVGFRYKVDKIAQRHPVRGTVRNLPSGEVEIDIEGDDDAVEAFIREVLENPPRLSRVEGVKRTSAEPRGALDFRVTG